MIRDTLRQWRACLSLLAILVIVLLAPVWVRALCLAAWLWFGGTWARWVKRGEPSDE